MNYSISVIIPVYNGAEYIEECVNSLRNQSIGFENIEVILVDDNSKDNSKEVITKLSNEFSNIKPIFLKSNTGTASGPRNKGILSAQSDYIMFLDMDDYYYPDMCKKMYETIVNESVEVVSCRYTMGDINNFTKVKNYFFDSKPSFIKVGNVYEFPGILSLGFSTMIWTKIFKKESVLSNNIEFPVGDLYEDVYFTSKFYLHADGIVLLTDFYGYGYHVRRDGDQSFSQKFSENMYNRQFSGFKKVIDLIGDDFNMIKSEIIIDMTKIFLYTELDDNKTNEFIEYIKPLYKSYDITTRVGTTNVIYNIAINVFIKIFSLNCGLLKLLSRFLNR